MHNKPFSTFRRRRPKFQFKTLVDFLFACLLIAGVYFLVFNIAPYYEMTVILNKSILGLNTTHLWQQLLVGMVAIAMWGIIQLAELFPLLMMRNSKFLEIILDKDSNRRKYKVNSEDNATIKSMKVAYNNLPSSFFRDLRVICVCAYPIDFLINCFINPPISGDAWRIIFGRTDLINWNNIFLNLWTVVVVEVIVIGLMWTWVLLQAFKYE